MRAPPLEELPRGQFVVHLRFAYDGPADEGQRLLAPMLDVGEVVLPAVGPMLYAQADLIHQDPTDPFPAWERGRLVRELSERTVEALLAVAGPEVDSPLLMSSCG